MITADIKCPRCSHVEEVSFKLTIFPAKLASSGDFVLELQPEIVDLNETTERFKVHYRTAHQDTALEIDGEG